MITELLISLLVFHFGLNEGTNYKSGILHSKTHQYSKSHIIPFPTHYTQLNVIGRGRHGVVYKALNSARQTVAVKLCPIKDHNDVIQAEKLVNILSRIDHPNILKYIESDFIINKEEKVDAFWMATEFIEGSTLAEALQQGTKKQAEIEEYRQIARLLLNSLQHLHHEALLPKGIIHGDLHSANLMILPNHSLKIIDFDSAHLGDCASEISKYWDYSGVCCILVELSNLFISTPTQVAETIEHLHFDDFIEKIHLGTQGNHYNLISHPFIQNSTERL